MFRELLRQIFSNQCQLMTIQLDIGELIDFIDEQDLKSHSYFPLQTTVIQFQTTNLIRQLKIRLSRIYRYFLEYLIEQVPNLEQLSIHSEHLSRFSQSIENSFVEQENWFNKVREIPKNEMTRLFR